MIDIKRADPRDFVLFLQASDDYAASLYPAESNHMLDVETLLRPQMNFFGVSVDGAVKGCGGFWAHEDYVEIKRVWIDPSARGLGLSRKLMTVVEDEARVLGLRLRGLRRGFRSPRLWAFTARWVMQIALRLGITSWIRSVCLWKRSYNDFMCKLYNYYKLDNLTNITIYDQWTQLKILSHLVLVPRHLNFQAVMNYSKGLA
jgi:putative acetyltransferase